MSNLLSNKPSRCVEINGLLYPVRYKARTIVRILERVEARGAAFDLPDQIACLEMFYVEMPEDLTLAAKKLIDFFRFDKKYKGQPTSRSAPSFSFIHDNALIYAAFRQQYGIADPGGLHWHVFRALFDGLMDCMFVRVVNIRSTGIPGTATREERAQLRKLKHTFALEQSFDIAAALAGV